MSENNNAKPAAPDAAIRSQIGAVVRRSVTRHCHVRNDAFFDLLAKDLAKVGHRIVSGDVTPAQAVEAFTTIAEDVDG